MKITTKILFFLSSLLLSAVVFAAAPAQIINLRFSDDAHKSRLVLDLTAPVQYHLNQTSNPQQITVDLDNAILAKPLSKAALKNLPIDLVSSAANKNNWRFIFTQKAPLIPKIFVLAPDKKSKYRLVIDLYKTEVVLEEPKEFSHREIQKKTDKLAVKYASAQKSASVPMLAADPVQETIPQTQAALVPKLSTETPKRSRPIVVVIDPGHGGKDPGAIGLAGNKEKNVVLAISRRLQAMINKEPGFRAVVTRDSDCFIPLRQRLDIARKYKADMFIAIHADAINNRDAIGASVFALSERGATSEAARWLAEKENQSEMIGVGDLSEKDQLLRSVLLDLSQTHTIAVSLQIGNSVLQNLSKITNLHYARVEQAAFVVLKSPDIPSLLVETGYISNPRQEQQLDTSSYQQQIANAILQGIKSYFLKHPPQGTLLA